MKVRYFYTIHYPYRYTTGPQTYFNKVHGWEDLESLDEARAIAEIYKVDTRDETHCETTYGRMEVYEVD